LKKFILVIFLFSNGYADEEFKSVETNGFSNYPPSAVFHASGLRKKGNLYIADVKKINKVLDSTGYFKDYDVYKQNGKLIIKVTERIPSYRILARSDVNYLFEIDSDYRIISSGKVFSKMPLLVINTSDLKNGKLSGRIHTLLDKIEEMKSSFETANEIEEIDLTDGRKAVLTLRNRRTKFCFFAEKMSFAKIDALTGYFDRYSVYPEFVELFSENAVLY
jgi:hypothetical protein